MRSASAKPWTATLVVLCASALGSGPAAADWPAWLERWLFNPKERTERTLASLESGDAGAAVEPAETALRLIPDRPLCWPAPG